MAKYKILKTTTIIVMLSGLTGCFSAENSDIKGWMNEQGKNAKGKIAPLPEAKRYVAVAYSAKSNPFQEREIISLADLEKNKYAPDLKRKKQPLEEYPLESLELVGTIYKDKAFYAMIKTKDNTIHYVTKGNYLGVNHGKVVAMEESQIVLDERIKDSTDIWKENQTVVTLVEEDVKNKSKKP